MRLLTAVMVLSLPSFASPLEVHEWGTFTSVANREGRSEPWRAKSEGADLPKFVYSESKGTDGYRAANGPQGKGERMAIVRMETPVIYFYTPVPMKVSVRVDFPKGFVTEWYPRATEVLGGGKSIDWGTFLVEPATAERLIDDGAKSHYYAARAVDAATVRVCSRNDVERERFLFYRGVGDVEVPLLAKADATQLSLSNPTAAPLGQVFVFENRGGKMGITAVDASAPSQAMKRPELISSKDAVRGLLVARLTGAGLFEKEAKAMVATWDDSWFEEGLRVFYLLPSAAVDAALPLTISPQPTRRVRVIVGRLEVLTPQQESDLATWLSEAAKLPDAKRAVAEEQLRQRYGRFAGPLIRRLWTGAADEKLKARYHELASRWDTVPEYAANPGAAHALGLDTASVN
jgi:hypothetical protein